MHIPSRTLYGVANLFICFVEKRRLGHPSSSIGIWTEVEVLLLIQYLHDGLIGRWFHV